MAQPIPTKKYAPNAAFKNPCVWGYKWDKYLGILWNLNIMALIVKWIKLLKHLGFWSTNKCQCAEQNLKSWENAAVLHVTGTQKIMSSETANSSSTRDHLNSSKEHEELIFEVAPGETPLALTAYWKGL